MNATAVAEQPVIVVVEDDPEALEQRTSLLASLDCLAIGFLTDEEAREAMLSAPVDLLLTDIRLKPSKGDRSGVELARYVKRTFPDMPVLGYSAVFADKDLAPLEKDTFDEVWPKNLDFMQIEELMQRCQSLARQHQVRRREALWQLFLKIDMFNMRALPAAAATLEELSEQDEAILRYVGEGLAPREIAELLDISEDDLYRFIGWVLDELPPEPGGETMNDVHERHGSRPVTAVELQEFVESYGPFSPSDDEG
jgi:DNA-binding NarL/FixJ family response regulator